MSTWAEVSVKQAPLTVLGSASSRTRRASGSDLGAILMGLDKQCYGPATILSLSEGHSPSLVMQPTWFLMTQQAISGHRSMEPQPFLARSLPSLRLPATTPSSGLLALRRMARAS